MHALGDGLLPDIRRRCHRHVYRRYRVCNCAERRHTARTPWRACDVSTSQVTRMAHTTRTVYKTVKIAVQCTLSQFSVLETIQDVNLNVT